MSTHNKKPPGHIHKIREFELEKIILSDEFDILQIVGEGWFGKILLVEHRATDTEMVLKALPKPYVSLRDFYREFHFGLHLGVHRNIVTTYDVAFETAGFYVFTQEYAPLGDLTSNVADSGIGELHSKKVAKQIASALDYMHSKEIVHRDVKLDNVLIYKSDFSRVKLCDFGESYKTGSVVERRNEWLPYSPPEVLQIQPEGTYEALPSHDVWQFAIVIFVCLTGCLPWQKASIDDPRYARYCAWQNVNMMIPLRRTPKLFKLLTSKASRMFRKFLEPRPERRPRNLTELNRFLDDRWLAKGSEKDMAEFEPDELCPSMYSFHSSAEEKNRVLWSLAEQGIETTVDRKEKKNRIKNWIESSVIMEDDEEEDSGSASASASSSVSREPVPGHISSVRAENEAEKARQKTINTTIKDASQKHFDPRTGALQQGPSAMGAIFHNQSLGNLSIATTTGNSLNSSLLTLGSRNNLIMSEGNPYQSDYQLNYDDLQLMDDGALQQQKMVNEQLTDYASSNNYMYYNNDSSNNYNYSNNNKNNIASKTNTTSTTKTSNSTLSITNNPNGHYNFVNFKSNNGNIASTTPQKTNLYHTLSDSNLTDTPDIDSNAFARQRQYAADRNDAVKPTPRQIKPLQRTKSDSLRKVLNFRRQNVPAPAKSIVDIDIDTDYNTNTNNNNHTHINEQQQDHFTASSATNSNNNNNNKNSQKPVNNQSKSNQNLNAIANSYADSNSVSKYGLMSAFKSIATISVPEQCQEDKANNNNRNNSSAKEQQFQSSNQKQTEHKNAALNNSNNSPPNNSNNLYANTTTNLHSNNNIKDSGYGSYDKVNTSSHINANTNTSSTYHHDNLATTHRNRMMSNDASKTNNTGRLQSNYNMMGAKQSIANASTATPTTSIQTTAQQTQFGVRRKNFGVPSNPSSMKDTPYDHIRFNKNNTNQNNNARK